MIMIIVIIIVIVIVSKTHSAYSIVSAFVMQSKVTLTFRKIELKSILYNDLQSKNVVLMVKILKNKRNQRLPEQLMDE